MSKQTPERRERSGTHGEDHNTQQQQQQQQQHPIPAQLRDLRGNANDLKVIALVGGPSGGKSLGLAAISTEVQRRTNYKVYCVPEAATMLVTGGLEWKDMNFERAVAYQLALLNTQIALEDNFKAIARACGQPALILCDRGTMDGRSYCSPEQWEEICRRGGYDTSQLRDARYDAVLHLVTSAIGAEKHYSLENNPARYEGLEDARAADLRVRQGWLGHPRIKLVENKEGCTFQDKLNTAVDFVFQCIGHAPPRHDKRRFLIRWDPQRSTVPVRHEKVTVTATVLAQSTPTSYSVAMIRQPSNGGSPTRLYLVNSKHNDIRSQQQLTLSSNEYNLLIEQRHPEHVNIVKHNLAFESNGAFYDLAVHTQPAWITGYATLYVDGLAPGAALPEFLRDAVETTAMEDLSSFHQSDQSRAAEIAKQLASVFAGKDQ